MKKITAGVLLLSAMVARPCLVNAQVSVGLKGGVNVSNVSGFKMGDFKTKALVGFHGGGFASFRFGAIAIQPELIYSTQGAKLEAATASENLKLNYFNIPVMLRYYTKPGIFLETGPQLGFNTSAELGSEDIKETVKSSDFGWGVGTGFQKGAFGIGARYNIGISKLGDAPSTNISDVDYKHGVFQVSLYFSLFGGR